MFKVKIDSIYELLFRDFYLSCNNERSTGITWRHFSLTNFFWWELCLTNSSSKSNIWSFTFESINRRDLILSWCRNILGLCFPQVCLSDALTKTILMFPLVSWWNTQNLMWIVDKSWSDFPLKIFCSLLVEYFSIVFEAIPGDSIWAHMPHLSSYFYS